MKRSALILTVIAAAAVIALVVVATRGDETEALAPATQGIIVEDPLGGDVAKYLVGYYRCVGDYLEDSEQSLENGISGCSVVNTVFRFVNPTSGFLEKHVALFDDDETLVGCYSAEMSGNDLEIDNLGEMLAYGWITDPETGEPIEWLPEEGVLKVVALDPLFPSAVSPLHKGIAGWAEYQLGYLFDGQPAADGVLLDGGGYGAPVQLAAVPGLILQQDQFSGPNQDLVGPDGRPDELVKIVDNCNPEIEPTSTPVAATPTPTSTPTPAPDVTPSATPDVTATATPWCFEVPGGLFCIPGGFIPET